MEWWCWKYIYEFMNGNIQAGNAFLEHFCVNENWKLYIVDDSTIDSSFLLSMIQLHVFINSAFVICAWFLHQGRSPNAIQKTRGVNSGLAWISNSSEGYM